MSDIYSDGSDSFSGGSDVLSGGSDVLSTGSASQEWATFSNTGYQNAPDYPGSLTVWEGPGLIDTSHNNEEFNFIDFNPGVPGLGANPENLLTGAHFHGCRFKGAFPGLALCVLQTLNCTWSYCTFEPGGDTVYQNAWPQPPFASSYQYAMVAGGPYNSHGEGALVSHCDFSGFGQGVEGLGGTVSNPSRIEWSIFHDPANDGQDGSAAAISKEPYHTDGISMTDTGATFGYLSVDHCTLMARGRNPSGNQLGGATNGIAWQQGNYTDVSVTNSLISGWGYGVAIWDTSTGVVFQNNTYTTTFRPSWGLVYPSAFFTSNPGSWRNNRWKHDPAGEWGSAADDGKFWIPNTGNFDNAGVWAGASGDHVSTTDYTG